AFTGYKASCIGRGRETIMAIFEKEYQENMSKDDAIMLALKAMKQVSEDPSQPMLVEIGIITKGTNFKILPPEEVDSYIKKLS
ncbi:MAG: proteasome subunit alpha, partial [Thermoplasmata archaeon]